MYSRRVTRGGYMRDLQLWKAFISLGVPGLALGVFFMLFRTFNWRFPNVPRRWVGPIVVVFMLLSCGLIGYSLSLWSPKASETSVKIGDGADVSGSIAGRDVGEQTAFGNAMSRNSVYEVRDSNASEFVASREIGKVKGTHDDAKSESLVGTCEVDDSGGDQLKTAKGIDSVEGRQGDAPPKSSVEVDKIEARQTPPFDPPSKSSVEVGRNANVSGYVAGRDLVLAFDPIKGRIDELIAILEQRHDKIMSSLSRYYSNVEVRRALREFDRLHRVHIDSLRQGKLLLAHETLIRIHEVLWHLHRRDVLQSAENNLVPRYAVGDCLSCPGVGVCEYITGEMTVRCRDPLSVGVKQFEGFFAPFKLEVEETVATYNSVLATH
jgi:hypothetical protein